MCFIFDEIVKNLRRTWCQFSDHAECLWIKPVFLKLQRFFNAFMLKTQFPENIQRDYPVKSSDHPRTGDTNDMIASVPEVFRPEELDSFGLGHDRMHLHPADEVDITLVTAKHIQVVTLLDVSASEQFASGVFKRVPFHVITLVFELLFRETLRKRAGHCVCSIIF